MSAESLGDELLREVKEEGLDQVSTPAAESSNSYLISRG